ncbi:hypothetical protein [Actinocorallia longicatena]|uniref:SaeA fourth Fn3-like domain-containing protein n=1 Tax=Actinocorallia longicatena TaxID=111803 RepID=A0ABP6QIE0_9ACTN
MSFDDDYKREVLEPARAAGDQPPEDLRVRYRLAEPMSAESVTAQVKQVRQSWRRSRGQLKYRKLIDRLEAEHRTLTPIFTAAEHGDLGPLRQRLRGGDERNAARRAEVRKRLLDAAGPLRLLAPAECEAIARDGGISRSELGQLLRIDGVEVHEPDVLPSGPPYPGYAKAQESLQVLGSRHLLAFLIGERAGGIRIFGGVSAGGHRIDDMGAFQALQRVAGEWARRPRDTSATHAETVLVALRTALREGFLHDLLGYDLVSRLRDRRAQRASDSALMDLAVRGLGLDPHDARRLVFAIGREGTGGSGPSARLRELLDSGQAHAAALLGDSITDPDAAAQIEEARQRVASASRLLDEALDLTGRGDLDEAWLRLEDALRLASDLPGAAEHQRRLPPLPPSDVRVSVDGTGVRVVHTASPSRAGDIVHEVVRRAGRAPFDSADGSLVPAGADPAPPVNVPLYYAVYARRGEATSSPVAAGPVVLRPEPGRVGLAAGDGTVTGLWECPAEAARIVVYRDGAPVEAGREGFTDRGVDNGTAHHYRVCAVYPDGAGEVETPGVRVTVTPHALPEPVTDFTVEPYARDRILLRFPTPDHGVVEAFLLDRDPPWPQGAVLPLADLAGQRIDATPHAQGLVVRPGASGVLLLVTVAGESVAIGASRRHVDLPAPSGLVAQRRGAEVHLGFVWPGDAAAVAVTYEIADGAAKRISVSRASYAAEGGVHLPVPESDPVRVGVCGTSDHDGAILTGPAVTATVAARPVVRYDVETAGPLWKRALVITLTPEKPVRLTRLDLVVRDGKVMPQRPGDGEILVSWQDFDLSAPTTLRVPMPKREGPFWLRCFSSPEAELADPPVRRLKQER